MATKRSHDASDGEEPAQPPTKRNKKPGQKSRDHQNAHIDPTWGQKYVFSTSESATTVPVDTELDFEDDADAMAYLRSVRTQANGIPHLLVAPRVPIGPQLPKELRQNENEEDEEGEVEDGEERGHKHDDLYNSGQGDFRGYYHDGAYTARPETWDADNPKGYFDNDEEPADPEYPEIDPEVALHEAYYHSILTRFITLRGLLHATPPADVVAALPRTHGSFVGALGARSSTHAVWSQRLLVSDPAPAQVASMTKDGVLRVVRVLLGGKFLRRGEDVNERTSRWLWALLARLPDRGELNHAEIGWVRDLGRRAVLMMQSLAHMAALRDALEGEGMDLGVHDAVDDSSDDEDVLREMEVDERDGEAQDTSKKDEKSTEEGESPADEIEKPGHGVEDDQAEDGEVDEQQSEPMDVSEDEGEIAEEAPVETLEEAKARLLAQVDTAAAEETARAEEESVRMRARINMRATLNMILTVAGEYYGQRDLLEFRDPFPGM
ncbi:hypothetical protein Cob_v005701 [Colletotrichum orbiculare MAFF 240422]|uniref:Uncharacterized protein n=1 Tax=Colletotrichum orbiculare (strain 104-T / ATCC 96160 / CBS 514.97 / LARS 414 / MAFF 240422) TaxID=1213857 RepID=N4VUA2_COLOR|nr:hypothetical protein Cob_v005701 [Colletotrichum orbiculare MAFF 240422]